MDMIADTSSHSLGDALSSPKVMEEDALQVQSPMSSLSLAGPGSICSHSGAASSGDGCEVDSYSSPDSEPHYDAETSKHDFDETTGSNEDHGTKINSPRVVEFSRIREAHPVLQSTGCTAGFCQGGRMIKTNEPRVGRDNVLSEVRTFAFDFLRQLRRDGILPSDEALRLRAQSVSLEIEESSTAVTEREAFRRKRCAGEEDNGKARVGGPWYQTFQELEHGVRLTWKNSPKCIMRSEHQGLQYVRFCSKRNMELTLVGCTISDMSIRQQRWVRYSCNTLFKLSTAATSFHPVAKSASHTSIKPL